MLLFGSITFVLHSGKFFHIYRPHRDGLLVAGPFVTDYPPPQLGEDPPLLRTRGYVILWGNRGGSVGSTFDSGPMCCRFESHPRN